MINLVRMYRGTALAYRLGHEVYGHAAWLFELELKSTKGGSAWAI